MSLQYPRRDLNPRSPP